MGSPTFWTTITASLAALTFGLATPGLAEEAVSVVVDRAKVFRIEEPAQTIIIGNPSIADVVMNDPTTLIITGKAYGTTNLVILDSEGQPIIDEVIVVRPQESDVVTVLRSGQRFSYNCSPTCQPTAVMGDQEEFYKKTSDQATQHSGQASSAANSGNE